MRIPRRSRTPRRSPYDSAVRARQARLLIEEHRYQNAYDIYRTESPFQMSDEDARAAVTAVARQLARGWTSRADSLDQAGRTVEAARAFQQAIALDEGGGDIANGGTDWFNYGQFLRRRGADPRLVMASLLEAETLLAEVADSRLDTVRQVRMAVEHDHPDAAAEARKDPAAALAAARTAMSQR